MLSDTICVLHTQNPRALQAEPSKPRFMDLLLGLVSVYQLLGLGLVSGANGLLGLGISHARASKNLLGSFAGLRESSDLIDITVYGKPGVKLVHKPITAIHTAAFTSEDGALFNVLPAFDKILSSLEEAKKKHVENSYFATCINLAWSKMDDYDQKTDISKVYLVASILDPRVKMRYFEKSWKKE